MPSFRSICSHVGVMIRTQFRLTESQLSSLREASAETGKSIAELVRRGVDVYLESRLGSSREERIQRALSVADRYSSGSKDGSVNHDRCLAEAFRRLRGRATRISTPQ